MDKSFADHMIQKFYKTFYGFALSKTYSLDEAEELTSRILLEAYVTLLKANDVYNWNGYLYRIANSVYSRYVMEMKKNRDFTMNDMEIISDFDFTKKIMQSEAYRLMKREIAWLSKMQREIIYMHYYENRKLSAISSYLGIPEGTVKWHLHDARKYIIEGMETMRNVGELGIKPIIFCNMGHNGWAANGGDTSNHLNTKLRQNIAFSAYYTPKTIPEISAELGVSPVYVEDEVAYLEEYGFLDKLSKDKYLTNIFIENIPLETLKEINQIQQVIAERICDEYVPLLINSFSKNNENICVPEHDFNYLLWSLIPMSLGNEPWLRSFSDTSLLDGTHYRVKRKDGGDYIAHASVYNYESEQAFPPHYAACGDMTRASFQYPVASWQYSTDFDLREFGWIGNQTSDFEYLFLFLSGKLEKTEATLEKFRRLYDRGLLVNKKGKDLINVIVAKVREEETGTINCYNNDLYSSLPAYPESLIQYLNEKFSLIYNIQKVHFPKNMHKLLAYYSRMNINRIMVLDELLKRGVLLPLTEDQKKGVMTVVFSSILPEL